MDNTSILIRLKVKEKQLIEHQAKAARQSVTQFVLSKVFGQIKSKGDK